MTGGIGLDLKNWVKQLDADGNPILDENGDPVLEQAYSVEPVRSSRLIPGRRSCIRAIRNWLTSLLPLRPRKLNSSARIGFYAIVFGKKLQTLRSDARHSTADCFAPSKEISHAGQGLTAVEKIFKNAVGVTEGGLTCRFGRARKGQYCWLAGYHRSDDFAGAGVDGRHAISPPWMVPISRAVTRLRFGTRRLRPTFPSS